MMQRPRQLRRRARNALRSVWDITKRSDSFASRQVRFITSFNEKLFHASGQRCVETFCHFNPHFELAVYIEADTLQGRQQLRESVEKLGAKVVLLDELPLLNDFLERARDLIPQSLGGELSDSAFPDEGPASTVWFRKHMFRWFRKTVALNHAVLNHAVRDANVGVPQSPTPQNADERVLVWMDCDCYSTRKLPPRVLGHAFDGAGIFHMKGSRPYSETGIVGYDLARPGVHDFIGSMITYYMERRFEPFERWDDCFAFEYLKTELQQLKPDLKFHDIGGQADSMGHILNTTLLAPYLTHDKGLHSRKLSRKLNF